MDNSLEKLLNQVGINEDYMIFFDKCYIKNVVVDKDSNCFNFVICMNNIPPKNVYDDLLNCLKEEFNNKVILTFLYDGDDYSNIRDYFNSIIQLDICYQRMNYIIHLLNSQVLKKLKVNSSKKTYKTF